MEFGLELSQGESDQLVRSWTMIDTNKKYHKDTFISRLFFNLLAGYPKTAEIFKKGEDITQHSELFGDLLYMTILNFKDVEALEAILGDLMMKNPSFCATASSYLEEMGSNLIFTLRQWLGTGIFNDSVQKVWIKLYIYVASMILQFAQDDEETELNEPSAEKQDSIREIDIPPPRSHARNCLESDAEESVQSLRPRKNSLRVGEHETEDFVNEEFEESDNAPEYDEGLGIQDIDDFKESRQDPDIEEPGFLMDNNHEMETDQALQSSQNNHEGPDTLRDPSLYVPEKHENPQAFANGNVIRFLISSNQKYKGFRRSVQEGVLQTNDIPIKVPSRSVCKRKSTPLSPPLSPPSLSSGSLKSTFSEEKASFDPRTFGRKSSQSSLLNSGLGKEDGLVRMNIYDSDSSSEIDSMKYSSNRIPLSLFSVSDDDKLATDNTIPSLLQKETECFDPRSRNKTIGSFVSESPEENKFAELSFEPESMTERHSLSESFSYGRRSPVFEPESFGIQGLEPISETNDDSDDNDASSSKYASDDEFEIKGESKNNNMNHYTRQNVSDSEDLSSGISLLSLHSSNYKSSVTSGDAASFEQGKDNTHKNTPMLLQSKTNVPYPAITSNHQRRLTYNERQNHAYTDSMDTLLTFAEQIPKRVSLGFMRSSFVLRKELENPSDNCSIVSPKSAVTQRKKPYGIPPSEDCKPFNTFDSFKKENSPKVPQQSSSFEKVRERPLINELPRKQEQKNEITTQYTKPYGPSLGKSSSWRNRLSSLFSKSSNLSDEHSVYSTDSKLSLAGFSIFSGFSTKKRSKYLVFLAS